MMALMGFTTLGGVRIFFRKGPIVPVRFKVCMPYINLVSCPFFFDQLLHYCDYPDYVKFQKRFG